MRKTGHYTLHTGEPEETPPEIPAGARPPVSKPGPGGAHWLPELFRAAGVAENAPLTGILAAMDGLANASAPVARSWWRWMVLILGICVSAPLLWLTRRALHLPAHAAGLVVFSAAALLAGALWWTRWRSMRRTWARARLVAEAARCRIAAAECPFPLNPAALEAAPALQPLPEAPKREDRKEWPEWKNDWVNRRLEEQLAYYRKARDEAVVKRRGNTRWTTLCMDGMLAVGTIGLVVTLSHRAPQWMRLLGDHRLEALLGAAGTLLPLAIVLLQFLRHLEELNRRAGRYTRQIAMLEKARAELAEAADPEEARRIMSAVEEQLLTEVVDWYFEAESAEEFFQIRNREGDQTARAGFRAAGGASLRLRPFLLAWRMGGAGLLFLLRVLLGRVPWVLGASAATLGWLSYFAPNDAVSRSRLEAQGALLDDTGSAWAPDPERAANGCVIIAHGLHDGAFLTSAGSESRWMRAMSGALKNRLRDRVPNIGLVNWPSAASPGDFHGLRSGVPAGDFLTDVSGIRSQAREVGDYLAFRLAQLVREKKIARDRTLHLIGHSAGGFVVARAAVWLKGMNLAPDGMRVTLLDTPGPDGEILEELPRCCAAEFYVTSGFVMGVREDSSASGMHVSTLTPPSGSSLLQAHSYATAWFTGTISAAGPGEEGFGRSPLARPETP